MDFHDAPETYAFYTEEVCAATAGAVQKAYEKDGAAGRLHLHIEPGMMHCYACAPVFRESRRDFQFQINRLKEL